MFIYTLYSHIVQTPYCRIFFHLNNSILRKMLFAEHIYDHFISTDAIEKFSSLTKILAAAFSRAIERERKLF